jgi:hypothetical protein
MDLSQPVYDTATAGSVRRPDYKGPVSGGGYDSVRGPTQGGGYDSVRGATQGGGYDSVRGATQSGGYDSVRGANQGSVRGAPQQQDTYDSVGTGLNRQTVASGSDTYLTVQAPGQDTYDSVAPGSDVYRMGSQSSRQPTYDSVAPPSKPKPPK